MVLGIVGFVFAWIPVIGIIGILMSLVGIPLGIAGVVRSNKSPESGGKGQAIAGIILGCLTIVIGIIAIAVLYAAVDELCQSDPTFC